MRYEWHHIEVPLTKLLSLTRSLPKKADKVLRQGDLLEASSRSSIFKEFPSLIKRMRIKEPFLHLMPIQWSSFLVSLLFSTFSTDASTWLRTGNIPVHNGRKRKLPSGHLGSFLLLLTKVNKCVLQDVSWQQTILLLVILWIFSHFLTWTLHEKIWNVGINNQSLVTDHVRSTREGNVFTGVCLSTGEGVGYILSWSCLGRGRGMNTLTRPEDPPPPPG